MAKINKTFILSICVLVFALCFFPDNTGAYGECIKYGSMAMYDSYSGTCECMAGYVFSSGLTGSPYCTSGDSVCSDKYGYNSRYDYLSSSCECSYGYVFGKDSIGRTRCVSRDSQCEDQLGYNSSYSSVYGTCQCDSGYVIDGGTCKNANSVCRSDFGYNSSYNSLSKKCECDSGYSIDSSGTCVEKQNNVYFTLKELDTSEKRAIIKSDYDYKYYLIQYGSGCYTSSFQRYLNQKIVVNLGTDFYLDTWDKIVLQDDDEVCDITRKDYADSNTTLHPEEETTSYYVPPVSSPYVQSDAVEPVVKKVVQPIINQVNKGSVKKEEDSYVASTTSSTSDKNIIFGASSTSPEISNATWYKKIWKFIWRF